MFKIDDKLTIHLTRGDIALIGVKAYEDEENFYTFQPNDVIRFSIYAKNNYNDVKFRKSVIVTEATQEVDLSLSREDTKLDDIINKPVDYWYEIELNPNTSTQTIIGHDEDGAKIFKLYPEGVDEIE